MDEHAIRARRSRLVLLEGHNLTLRHGTGIATYARGLAAAATQAGYRIDVLVGSNRKISAADPQLGEIVLFDGPRHYNLIHKGYLELRRALGAPFGLSAGTLDGIRGVVLGSGPNLAAFERIHAIPHLMDVERLHFMRHRRRLRVRTSETPDIFHATRPAPLEVRGAANIYTIHDLVPLRLPYTTADDKAYHVAMIRELAKVADHIITVSEFSRQDIIAFTGIESHRITNTYQTVGFPDELLAESDEEVARQLAAKHALDFKQYYLFVGAIEPKKNVSRLIDAYAAAATRRPLVLAGGLGWMYEADVERIRSERFLTYIMTEHGEMKPQRSVRHLAYLPLKDIVQLIRGARALLYPSVYEGFGLPVAEAMLLGTPVLTSRMASLPEIADGAAEFVDPYDVTDITRGIRIVDCDDDLVADMAARGRMAAQRFSAEKHRARLAEVYQGL